MEKNVEINKSWQVGPHEPQDLYQIFVQCYLMVKPRSLELAYKRYIEIVSPQGISPLSLTEFNRKAITFNWEERARDFDRLEVMTPRGRLAMLQNKHLENSFQRFEKLGELVDTVIQGMIDQIAEGETIIMPSMIRELMELQVDTLTKLQGPPAEDQEHAANMIMSSQAPPALAEKLTRAENILITNGN